MEEVTRTLCVGRGLEDGAFVFPENGEPVADIGGMVIAVLEVEAEICAKERRAQFSNKFFAGIAGIPETLAAEIPVEP